MRAVSIPETLPIACALFIVLSAAAWAAEPGGPSRQQEKEWEVEITLTIRLNHLLYLPKGYDEKDSWPLLVFLHGMGERGNDLELIKKHGPPKLIDEGRDFPFIVVSPQSSKKRGWEPKALIELIDLVANTYKVGKDRIYLTGLSMGGFGTWSLAAEYPDVFAAIVPICGGGDPDSAPRLKNVPTWVFHGAEDKTVPLKRSQEMVDALKAAGGNVKLTVYPEAGHDSWTETYANPEVCKWLLKHKRGG